MPLQQARAAKGLTASDEVGNWTHAAVEKMQTKTMASANQLLFALPVLMHIIGREQSGNMNHPDKVG
ncbi:MAG: hypothetical protein AB7F74_29720 [Parvibaculaceae bacterium]